MTAPSPSRRSLFGALFAALFAGLFCKKGPVAAPATMSATSSPLKISIDANASTMVFSASGLPAGLSLNSNSGCISGHIGPA